MYSKTGMVPARTDRQQKENCLLLQAVEDGPPSFAFRSAHALRLGGGKLLLGIVLALLVFFGTEVLLLEHVVQA